jgi:hypothetical protein
VPGRRGGDGGTTNGRRGAAGGGEGGVLGRGVAAEDDGFDIAGPVVGAPPDEGNGASDALREYVRRFLGGWRDWERTKRITIPSNQIHLDMRLLPLVVFLSQGL